MDKLNKQELRRLAGEASQGKWQHATEQGQIGSVECSGAVMVQVQQMKRGDNAQRNANAAFIAAANPAAILSLLDELEQCRADANDVWGLAQGRADAIDQLRAELEQYRKDAERYRWLKEQWHGFQHYRDSTGTVANVDREIDEAIAVCNWKPMAKEGGANG